MNPKAARPPHVPNCNAMKKATTLNYEIPFYYGIYFTVFVVVSTEGTLSWTASNRGLRLCILVQIQGINTNGRNRSLGRLRRQQQQQQQQQPPRHGMGEYNLHTK